MNVFGMTRMMPRLVTAVLLGTVAVGIARAEVTVVHWQRIEGINPNPTGQTLNGIVPVGFPWSVDEGRAVLNPANGRTRFHVAGLSMGASPTAFAAIGTTGAVTRVKGTVMCNQTGEFVDTDDVKLSPEGDAYFVGQLPFVPACEPGNLIFLLRIAEVVAGAPPITNLWLAHGAARRIHHRQPHTQR